MFLWNIIPAYFFNRYWERRREAELLNQHAQLINKYKAKTTIKHSYYKQSHLIKDFHWEWNKAAAESMLISILKQDRVLSKLNIVPFRETIKFSHRMSIRKRPRCSDIIPNNRIIRDNLLNSAYKLAHVCL